MVTREVEGTVTVRKFGNEAVREADEDTSSGGGSQ